MSTDETAEVVLSGDQEDFQEYVDGLRPFINDEMIARWGQGDYLVSHPCSSARLAKVAEYFQLRPSTLVRRKAVAQEFPAEPKDDEMGRDTSIAYGIFAALLGVPKTEDRKALFAERQPSEWTVPAMETAVRKFNKGLGTAASLENIVYRGGMKLDQLRIKGEMFSGNTVELVIETEVEDPDIKVRGNRTTITFTV